MEKIHLTIGKDQKFWFTSDLHFGHDNVIKFCNRPYENSKEMNEDLVNRWNEVVRPQDHVFVLGDFFWFGGAHAVAKFTKRLRGTIHLIPGNHDQVGNNGEEYKGQQGSDKSNWYRLSDNVIVHSDITVLFVHDQEGRLPKKCVELVMCHYPLLCYSHSNNKEGCFQLFGHIHSKPGPMMEFGAPIKTNGNQYDVGCDRHDYRPIELFDMLEKIEQYKKSYPNLLLT